MKISEELEKVIKGCTSMKAICKAAVVHLEVREALKDSLEPVMLLLCSLFQRLKLKDEPFSVFTSGSYSEMDTLASVLAQTEPGTDPTSCSKINLADFPVLSSASTAAAKWGITLFSILKCGSNDWCICKPPRPLKKVFDTMRYITDLITDGIMYKPLDEFCGTVTSEKDQPSFNSSAENYTMWPMECRLIPLASSQRMLVELWYALNVASLEYCIHLRILIGKR